MVLAGERRRLSLKDWHDVLCYINPGATEHSEKQGLIEVLDYTVPSDVKCSTRRESKSKALSYGHDERTPKPQGEVVNTDIKGRFGPDEDEKRYFIVFVEESRRDQRVIALKTRDATVETTGHSVGRIRREGTVVKSISGDNARELERSSIII